MQELLPTFLMFGGIFAIMYFLMIRPQQQKAKAHQDMVSALSRGDHVILQGGLYGKITKVNEETIEVEVADGVVIRQVKSMVLAMDAKPEPVKPRLNQQQKQRPKRQPASPAPPKPKQTKASKPDGSNPCLGARSRLDDCGAGPLFFCAQFLRSHDQAGFGWLSRSRLASSRGWHYHRRGERGGGQ